MKPIARLTVLVLVVALSLACAPRSGNAGAAATSNATSKASNCYFVRNHLPCPCPSARRTRAIVNAARVTAGALGNAFGTTTAALTRAESARPPAR